MVVADSLKLKWARLIRDWIQEHARNEVVAVTPDHDIRIYARDGNWSGWRAVPLASAESIEYEWNKRHPTVLGY
jgi:hypothetical protein